MFQDYTKKSYENVGDLSQSIAFPRMLSWYKGYFNKLYYVEVCEEYIQKVKKEKCTDQLLRSSLETISISIIERSKKVLTKFRGSETTQKTAIKLMNSHEVIQLGNNFTQKPPKF